MGANGSLVVECCIRSPGEGKEDALLPMYDDEFPRTKRPPPERPCSPELPCGGNCDEGPAADPWSPRPFAFGGQNPVEPGSGAKSLPLTGFKSLPPLDGALTSRWAPPIRGTGRRSSPQVWTPSAEASCSPNRLVRTGPLRIPDVCFVRKDEYETDETVSPDTSPGVSSRSSPGELPMTPRLSKCMWSKPEPTERQESQDSQATPRPPAERELVPLEGGRFFRPLERCTYEGGVEDDVEHGAGTLVWEDGRRYVGQFKSGRFHGEGVMTWVNGREYKGQYADDRKHGEGSFTWGDGRRYEGQWVDGKKHGIGVYTNAKGLVYSGKWQMDRPFFCAKGDVTGRASAPAMPRWPLTART